MSRGIFNSNNKTTEVFTFKTNSDSGTTFDPQFSSNSIGSNRRVHIDYGDGSLGYDAELYPSHTYSDNGDVKDVKVYFGDFDNITILNLFNDDIYGTLDLTNPSFRNCYNFALNSNSLLSGVTHGYNPSNMSQYYLYNCNITGNHDMSMFPNLGGIFYMYGNHLQTEHRGGNASLERRRYQSTSCLVHTLCHAPTPTLSAGAQHCLPAPRLCIQACRGHGSRNLPSQSNHP